MFINLSQPEYFTFGRINSQKKIIVPNLNNFDKLSIKNENNLINPIAKKLYTNLLSDFNKASITNKIDKENTNLFPIKISSAGSNVYARYERYISSLFDDFITNFNIINNIENLITFENVTNEFIKFLINLKTAPITFSSFAFSRFVGIQISGLSIILFDNLTNSEIDNDINYNFYVNTIFNNGFVINENNKSNIILNFGSKLVIDELSKLGINDISTFYSNYYIEANTIDIIFLSSLITKKYNEFCIKRPYAHPRRLCSTGYVQDITARTIIDFKNLYSKYNYLYWLKIYLYLKGIETYKDWSQQDFDYYINNLENVYNSNLDSSYANGLKYVNDLIGKYPYPQSMEPIKFYYEPRL